MNPSLYYSNFTIPSQIDNLNKENYSKIPINFDKSSFILSKDESHPIVFVMVFGQFQSGKSNYLKTITRNAAFNLGRGTKSTTYDMMFDGPYLLSEQIDVPDIIYSDVIQKCKEFEFDDDTSIDFIDSQGSGDEEHETIYKPVFDKILSTFLSVSIIAITVSNFNQKQSDMENILRGQLIPNDPAHILFLMKKMSIILFYLKKDGINIKMLKKNLIMNGIKPIISHLIIILKIQ